MNYERIVGVCSWLQEIVSDVLPVVRFSYYFIDLSKEINENHEHGNCRDRSSEASIERAFFFIGKSDGHTQLVNALARLINTIEHYIIRIIIITDNKTTKQLNTRLII